MKLTDDTSQHTVLANESVGLGSIDQPGGSPYLNIGLIVRFAVENRVHAIHPGYGYPSENADFATAVRNAGITFVGPSSSAMETLGDKRSARAYLREHEPSVPLIPGFAGKSQELVELARLADEMGYPVMLKASAGGRWQRNASSYKNVPNCVQSWKTCMIRRSQVFRLW
ncbi:hypothetical protein J3459_011925 [Metarhizium acridum]|nr:hypothetical protein J3459_011925 [Metarhizium acridum]